MVYSPLLHAGEAKIMKKETTNRNHIYFTDDNRMQ